MRLCLASLVICLPLAAGAHQLNVFASVDCQSVLVEAKFSNGKAPVAGQVRVLDGDNTLLSTLDLAPDGTRRVPLDSMDHSGGLVIEVDTGSHEDYWIVTPEDIARKCGS
ncbi:MAG: hypothetical protein AAFQ19_08535 [Pseudomonadota bacterium]